MINYKVITLKDNLDALKKTNTKVYKIKFNDHMMEFYTNSIDKINGLFEFECINITKKKFNKLFKEYVITFIGILLFIFMLIILNKTVTEIKFINEDTYDEEVYDLVNNELDCYYGFKLLNKKLSLINDKLKQKFYNYEWINVEKEGTKLLINISKSTEDNKNNIENSSGSLYSKYDAYIKGYYVQNGRIVVTNNMSVKKDDELISGIVPLYNDKISLVKASGYVIGEVYEVVSVNVDKIYENTKRSGRFKIINRFIVGDKEIKSPFENYETKITEIFSLFNFIKYVKIEFYELVSDKVEYDIDSGMTFGKSQIMRKFNEEVKYDFEKVISISLINKEEDSDSYVYTYGVKSIRDITYFKELK